MGIFLLSSLFATAQGHSGDVKYLSENTYCTETLEAIKNVMEANVLVESEGFAKDMISFIVEW